MEAPAWRSRIVGHGEARPDSLIDHPLNDRNHAPDSPAQQALVELLRTVGPVAPVIVNTTTGRLLDGHGRKYAALTLGLPVLPVTYVAVEPHEEPELLLFFDAIRDEAVIDREKYLSLLGDVLEAGEVPAAVRGVLDGILEQAASMPDVVPKDLPTPDIEQATHLCPRCGHRW